MCFDVQTFSKKMTGDKLQSLLRAPHAVGSRDQKVSWIMNNFWKEQIMLFSKVLKAHTHFIEMFL